LIAATVLAIVATLVPPSPAAPIPREPAALAQALNAADAGLEAAIARWRNRETPPPRDVALFALYQQRIYLALTTRPGLAGAALDTLPRRRAAHLRDTLFARANLLHLSQPRPLSAFRTGRPAPAAALLRYYRQAQRRYGIAWNVLAAVNFVESAFGKLRNASTAGARGPMQFLPSTWRRYGLGGDVDDPRDAILGAANYLRAAGAPRSYRRALYAYNPSRYYVAAVLLYARRMRADPRTFLEYYAWQVFVRTPRGLRRLTGPGL
jgi:membrane-bound lytic murein transglycosylase B